jgi:hypothetical protein
MNQYRGISTTVFFLFLSLYLLSGCGGGGSEPSASIGQFIDSPVQGVDYQSISFQGTTDFEGKFNYKPGEETTFSIGSIVLGTAVGGSIITPFDLVPGATDESDPAVVIICRFLQSLDDDNDPSNGIVITPEIAAELEGVKIEDFSESEIQDLLDSLNIPRHLISEEEAFNHFSEFLGTVDKDNDGYMDDEDCNDIDPNINPGVIDIACDGIDQDCSGADALDAICTDADNDDYTADIDCNDNEAEINPGATEIVCDGIDQDCSGSDKLNATCTDTDNDNYTADVDCNDSDAGINPGATEIVCDGIDQDCSGLDKLEATCTDADKDGYTADVDCNDNNRNIYPGARDNSCNGRDNDCDGGIDEDYVTKQTSCGFGICAAIGSTSCVSGQEIDSCVPGTPLPDNNCDGIDNDCDGYVDDDYVENLITCGAGVCEAAGSTSCVNGQEVDSCEPDCSLAVLVDHSTLKDDLIPQADLNDARALRMSFDHASVGNNIKSGMEDMKTINAARYSYPNWDWRSRGNPGWQAKIDQFVEWVAIHKDEYDVFQMKFCYIDGAALWTNYRDAMLNLEATYPDKVFIWWTMPIKTSGASNRDAFNNAVRSYSSANGKPLFDIAAIESHDPSGNPVSDGGYEAMYPGYSDDGGHLNATGRLRAAQAMWWLMARVAGWVP